ncbi:hypothetical protein GCM10023332_04940 [Luteimonas vadosa]|uniref:Uncharacterized protein n=2 Tax=Luteimonas vadosa TaxID=1165507 RepID=A0ABP9DPZ5_9GAMM
MALCAGLVLALPACEKAADAATESAIERASGQQVDVDRDGDRLSVKTADGEFVVQSGESLPLPADFPDDVYLPDRYSVNSVMDMGGTRMVSVTTQGKVAGIFGAAQQAMAKAGWTQTMSMQHSVDTAMLSYEKDHRAAVLSFNKGEGSDGVVMGVQLRTETQ